MKRPTALSPEEAKKRILRILLEGDVIPTVHCRQRMLKRRVDIQDVVNVLEFGAINKNKTEWDDVHDNWKYRVEGEDIEGEELVVITVIIESDCQSLVVTVF